ncbi:MAG: N-6 DNA methylase [Candidatus Lokiarchaeota archaeon]|nr:N-6 DNA methylase [Candidatus Lokiarchaeota archaeon]
MVNKEIKKNRRTYGEHLTPIQIFENYILPEIKERLFDFKWIDLFAGQGNLILPILKEVPEDERNEFFKKRIFLFDIQDKQVKIAIENAVSYGIKKDIAIKNIKKRDTLKNYPMSIFKPNLPVFHITNPPYLYLGYIMKHEETKRYLELFQGENDGYQDLYQIALINDLRNGLENMIYIIPSNFLFSFSAANKIRRDFLEFYNIKKTYIFEEDIFEYTGQNVIITFFKRKKKQKKENISFKGIRVGFDSEKKIRRYDLDPKTHYRAGNEFEEFLKDNKCPNHLRVKYYLTAEEIEKNKGEKSIQVIDANNYKGNKYEKKIINVNRELYDKIRSNFLFIRTVDTGSIKGRAGLYSIHKIFGVDGILVSKAKYRTHPIQVFIKPDLNENQMNLLKKYFNLVLEYFRDKYDSDFLTTYKYSNASYVRKYLGLSQTRKLIQTFPIHPKDRSRPKFDRKYELIELIKNKKGIKIVEYIKKLNQKAKIAFYL